MELLYSLNLNSFDAREKIETLPMTENYLNLTSKNEHDPVNYFYS